MNTPSFPPPSGAKAAFDHQRYTGHTIPPSDRRSPVTGSSSSKPSVGGWRWAVLFFGWLGGLIGYLSLRSDDPGRANHVMKWGIIASLLWVVIAAVTAVGMIDAAVSEANDSDSGYVANGAYSENDYDLALAHWSSLSSDRNGCSTYNAYANGEVEPFELEDVLAVTYQYDDREAVLAVLAANCSAPVHVAEAAPEPCGTECQADVATCAHSTRPDWCEAIEDSLPVGDSSVATLLAFCAERQIDCATTMSTMSTTSTTEPLHEQGDYAQGDYDQALARWGELPVWRNACGFYKQYVERGVEHYLELVWEKVALWYPNIDADAVYAVLTDSCSGVLHEF